MKKLLRATIIIVGIGFVLGLGAILILRYQETTPHILKYAHEVITLGGTPVTVDIADTQEKRVLGLSGRESIAEDTGMLFAFDIIGAHTIWMKNMNFPIDILWIDASNHIVHIEQNISPDTYPDTFSTPTPAAFVLELPADFTNIHAIQVGDSIERHQ